MAAKRKQPIFVTRIQYGHKRNKQEAVVPPHEAILSNKVKAAEYITKQANLGLSWVTFSDGSVYRVTYHGCYQVAKAEVAK